MLLDIYDNIKEIKDIEAHLGRGEKVQVNGCVPSQKEHFLYGIGRDYGQRVIVTANAQGAMEILENLLAFDKNAAYYPARDPMFYKADIKGSYITEQRIEAVKRICNNEDITILTTPDAFTDRLASKAEIKSASMIIKKGDSVDNGALADRLTALGYENSSQVYGHGEFSIRGNIIDIFPRAKEAPYRLDLWGDVVDNIKIFDAETQRSIEEADEVEIFSGGDKSEADEGDADFLSYFDPENTLFVFDEPARILQENETFDIRPFERASFPCLFMSMLGMNCDINADHIIQMRAKSVPSYNGRFSQLTEDIEKYKHDGWHVTLCCASAIRADRLRGDLERDGVSADVVIGTVRCGFEYTDLKEVLITEADIFGRRINKRRKKRFTGDPIKSFTDLNVGDHVVHEQHGIGLYKGITRLKSDGVEKDYMKIEYAGGANLYVLATQFDRIQKYSGGGDVTPKLSKLGGKEWVQTKTKTKKAVRDIAEKLVQIYAARRVKKGFVYSPDTVWQREFEESFEFEETDDQLKAIEDVKSDMEQGKVMDRLICGDVGFGKTEVAVRAAFKAVQDGKQVIFLAPTTILVSQHYETFKSRMSGYPINIRMLSRFVSSKDQKKIIEELKSGRADIVIGTHKLLSKEVGFKDPGLLIIDEEQRFGVAHKEKIKSLRENIDVLTLSATPIPRTLHMSLAGIRDMSLLTEPPVDRIPVQTYVMEYSKEAVTEAILREHARGGQVYYIYNRVDSIEETASAIQEMLPTLRVRFAHGRMASRELEQIMTDYINGEIDVLVSTTIVESGLDIPNVNTIIIQDADKYGLSQLYQLRGRVGRSNRMSYAFLMYRPGKILKEIAEERLKAIKEFSELGGGIRIAMKDLEIRGAGNVLGAEQSGHMDAVGYELYCKMLNEAVQLLKGQEAEEDYETTIDLKVDAYIPSEYIKNAYEKLNMYKKISVIDNEENAEDVAEELKDRFGAVPKVTENLINIALIKSAAHKRYITEISGGGSEYKIEMFPGAKIDTYKMNDFLRKNEGRIKFVHGKAPGFVYKAEKPARGLEDDKRSLMLFFGDLDEIMQKK